MRLNALGEFNALPNHDRLGDEKYVLALKGHPRRREDPLALWLQGLSNHGAQLPDGWLVPD